MRSVGLVLGGGGLVGYAYHVAVLSALSHHTGWDPRTADVIVGTSAGAGVAALLRGGVPIDAALDRLVTLPTDVAGLQRLQELSGRRPGTRYRWPAPLPAAPGLAARELLRGPFARPGRLLAALLPRGRASTGPAGVRPRALHGARWPELPLWIPTVRLSDGARIVFGRDRTDIDVATAVEASCAIPGVFRPVTIDGVRHLDGGFHSPTNADLLAGLGLDAVVVSSALSAPPVVAMRSGPTGAVRLICHALLNRETRAISAHGTPVLRLEPGDEELRSMGANPLASARALGTALDVSASMRRAMPTLEAGFASAFASVRASAAATPHAGPDVPYPAD